MQMNQKLCIHPQVRWGGEAFCEVVLTHREAGDQEKQSSKDVHPASQELQTQLQLTVQVLLIYRASGLGGPALSPVHGTGSLRLFDVLNISEAAVWFIRDELKLIIAFCK